MEPQGRVQGSDLELHRGHIRGGERPEARQEQREADPPEVRGQGRPEAHRRQGPRRERLLRVGDAVGAEPALHNGAPGRRRRLWQDCEARGEHAEDDEAGEQDEQDEEEEEEQEEEDGHEDSCSRGRIPDCAGFGSRG